MIGHTVKLTFRQFDAAGPSVKQRLDQVIVDVSYNRASEDGDVVARALFVADPCAPPLLREKFFAGLAGATVLNSRKANINEAAV